MIKVYLLLGGNLGDKKKVFENARIKLENQLGEITAQSAIYETEPWGFESDDLFWNQALEITTSLAPEEVLQATQQTEQELGRIRKTNQYDSRIIDIDILMYNAQMINLENLTIPHPRLQERKFALIPLNEIAPELVHPLFQKSIGQLLDECPDRLQVKIVSDKIK
jgi:2-amino-4-hydroxy-6-hydroxymethyldihydropteridine diphosphokinase